MSYNSCAVVLLCNMLFIHLNVYLKIFTNLGTQILMSEEKKKCMLYVTMDERSGMSWFLWEFRSQEGEMPFMQGRRKQNVFAEM